MELFMNGLTIGILAVSIGALLKIVLDEYALCYRRRKAEQEAERIKTVYKAISFVNGNKVE